MSPSPSPVYSTAFRIIKQAYKNAKRIGDGQDLSSEQIADGLNLLNDMINLWQTQGLKLWLQFDLSITLNVGQALYTFGPSGTNPMTRPTRVIQGYYLYANNGAQRPLDPPLSYQEYKNLSQVTTLGAVSQYMVDKQPQSLNVYFWLTPDSLAATQGTAHIIIQQQVANVVSITDTMNFPVEWFAALHWGLSTFLCTGQPEAVTERCDKMAFATHEAVSNWDVEDASTKFTPDPRVMYSSGGFK